MYFACGSQRDWEGLGITGRFVFLLFLDPTETGNNTRETVWGPASRDITWL